MQLSPKYSTEQKLAFSFFYLNMTPSALLWATGGLFGNFSESDSSQNINPYAG
jgi:hypothetical protein